MAFSDRQEALEKLHAAIRRCNNCGLCASATHHVVGEGPADAALMLVGEAPGAQEDKQGRPFVGPSGHLLTRLLERAGVDRKDVFITSVVKCRPPGNRDPLQAELAACAEHLRDQLAIIRPKVICTLGRFAAQTLIDKKLSITREHGQPRRIEGTLFIPLYHPAAALHQQQLLPALEEDMTRLRGILNGEFGRHAR